MSSVKLAALEAKQAALRKKFAKPGPDPRSSPPGRLKRSPRRRTTPPRPKPPCLTHADVLRWQATVLSCVLHRSCEGRSVTADELMEQITPDGDQVGEARRFMDTFLAILERKGYSTRPAMLP